MHLILLVGHNFTIRYILFSEYKCPLCWGRPGLFLNVTKLGTKSWHFRYSIDGQQDRIIFGKYPLVSIKDARLKCLELQKIVASGINPKTKEISDKNNIEDENMTFGQFIEQWKTIKFKKLGFVDPNRRNSTQTQIERYLEKDMLPALGRIPLKLITRQDVLQLLRKMEQRGAFVPAEKCRSWLKEIFSHALVVG